MQIFSKLNDNDNSIFQLAKNNNSRTQRKISHIKLKNQMEKLPTIYKPNFRKPLTKKQMLKNKMLKNKMLKNKMLKNKILKKFLLNPF